MTVTLERCAVPALHRDYPGFWVVRNDVAVGLVYHVDHLDGSQTWWAIRRGTETWFRFGSREEAVAWGSG